MFKGLMTGDDWEWEKSHGTAEVKGVYKEVTFVLIDGKMHIRSSHLPNEPFVELDPDTCKVKEGYEPWTSEGNLLNWTSDTEQSTIGDEENGYRYLRPT
jgi:hypothetical protein